MPEDLTKSFKDLRLNSQKRDQLIIKKCVEMLGHRNLLNKDDFETNYKIALESYDELTHLCSFNTPKLSFKVRIINEKVSTLNKISGLTQLLDSEQDILKLIVVQDIQLKPFSDIIEYSNAEVFWIHELIIDPVNHIITPKHIPLTNEEKENVLKEYEVKKKDLPRIDITDFMVRYYKLSEGDIFEIHRISIASGEAVTYRLVTKCSWEKLFLKA